MYSRQGYASQTSVGTVHAMGGLEISYSAYGLVLGGGNSVINNLSLTSGSITTVAGTTITLLGNSILGGVFRGPGLLQNTGTTNVAYGRMSDGTQTINTGTMMLNQAYFSLNNGNTDLLNQGGFEIGGTSTEVRGTSLFTNDGSLSFLQTGNNTFWFSPAYIQHGTMMISDGIFRLNSVSTDFAGGDVTVSGGATLLFASNAGGTQTHTFSGLGSLGGTGIVENREAHTVTAPLTIAMGTGDPATVNGTLTNAAGGSIGVEAGADLQADQMENGSTFDSVVPELTSIVVIAKTPGNPATITTPLLNNHGRIAPGERNRIGTLHLNGSLVQHASGDLDIDLRGATPDSLHDQLTITGPATLAGSMTVRLGPGFWPLPGQEFTIITATGGISGAITSVNQPLGATFSLRHELNRVVLVTDSVTGPSAVPTSPNGFALEDAFPNPFNPSTTISFHLPESRRVTLTIHDAAGRLVRTLLHGELSPQGRRQIQWDGRDLTQRPVAAGVYFIRLEAGSHHATRRMTLVK